MSEGRPNKQSTGGDEDYENDDYEEDTKGNERSAQVASESAQPIPTGTMQDESEPVHEPTESVAKSQTSASVIQNQQSVGNEPEPVYRQPVDEPEQAKPEQSTTQQSLQQNPGVPETVKEDLDAEEQENEQYHQQQPTETPFKSGDMLDQGNDDEGQGSGYIGEFSSEYINAEIFKLFDMDNSGKITREDLQECAKAMGWSDQQLDEFILELDPNHDGEITEEEFMLVMKYIQQRTSTQFPPISHSQSHAHSISQSGVSGNETISQQQQHQMQLYESDKRKYGALLPKTGVYFLPDDKVIGFLKILNCLRIRHENEENYTGAKLMKQKFDEFSRAEQQRQEQNMRLAQEKELMNIEGAQKAQFTEFQQAWDKYMADYEQTAFQLIEKLKMKQEQEMIETSERIAEEFRSKVRGTKNIVEKKKQEKIFFSVKDYDRAEIMRRQIEQQEIVELAISEEKLQVVLSREQDKLRAKQALTLQSLLKRIQRDREEQVKHRQQDSQRLIQRNKNLLQDILEKQATEQRRTYTFLRFALGKREEKSVEMLKHDMSTRSYNPKNDPLMPRLFKKYNPNASRSVISNHSTKVLGNSSANGVYDNTMSAYNRERYTLVNHPLRTKVAPAQVLRTEAKSVGMHSLLKSQQQSNMKHPEDMLNDMKQLRKTREDERNNQYGHQKAVNSPDNLPQIDAKRR